MDEKVERILSQLNKITEVGDNEWTACCPAHEDKTPSFWFAASDGFLNFKCHKGCTEDLIRSSLSLTEEDCKPAKPKGKQHETAKDAIEACIWSVSQKYKISKATQYEYKNADGSTFGYVVRCDVSGDKVFKQIKHLANGKWQCTAGNELWPLYRLTEIPKDGEVFLHEGEKAACAGAAAGLPSIASKGGSEAPKQSDWTPLAGMKVNICPDNDTAGEKYAATVTEILHQLVPPATVKIVRLNDRPEDGGDFADILAACDDCKDEDVLAGLRQEVEQIIAETEPEKVAPLPAPIKEPAPNIFDSKNRKMVSECMAGIEPKEVVWFWKNRIPIGQLTLLTGPQGGTKSFLTMDLATRVSQGWSHPDGTGTCPQGQALFFTTEDEPATAIVPRLKACGADLTQIHYMHGTTDDPEDDNENARRLKLNTDIELLEEEIQRLGNVKLLIFDPLEDYIDGDSNNNKEVRTALTTLKAMAQRQDIAVVAVHHINKRSKDVSAVQTAGGAGAWTQVPRSVLHIVTDPNDENVGFTRRRLMVCTKSNYGGDNQAQAYRLTADQHPRIEWLPEVLEVCANSVIRSSTESEDGRKKTDKRESAISDLYEIMQPGPMDSKEIDKQMNDRGHSSHMIRVAREENALEKIPRTTNTDPHMWKLPAKPAVDDTEMDDFYSFADSP